VWRGVAPSPSLFVSRAFDASRQWHGIAVRASGVASGLASGVATATKSGIAGRASERATITIRVKWSPCRTERSRSLPR
jgi:hypothetical protein